MNSTDQAVLIVRGGPHDGETILIAGRTTTFGRQTGNDVVVDEPGVSRQHAEIVETEVGYYLSDLSSNGTYVKGKRIEEGIHHLSDGDTFRLGPSDVSFTFRSPSSPTIEIVIPQ